ncbi:glycosyltransferase family 2 protein [Roseicyclus persicicus]|uniref:Glycosyl transferase family 2 n=1 Tax=Roseicyclus persicicus TaxID=2650661 RepID=A0A7X6H0V9_9RHOB|nr:glycosyltransferase family 2 protein [Roseibacterium persicicum]NKX45274.1 hypothetical protein [Roseibacterium persicicum]
MDDIRKPLAVMTMVYGDYPFLKRWYDYYGAQVGPEHLYVFSHGNDPEHRRIAPEANILNVPRDPGMVKFDRRRWKMMSHVASGLLEFYSWVIVADVDEIVIVDPDVAPGLVEHLHDRYADPASAPRSVAPFALNMIHVPEFEPLPIEEGTPILSRRRHFLPSRVYSKPCLVREPVVFGPGGHRNNLGRRTLSDALFLVHLKSADLGWMTERSDVQAELVSAAALSNPDYQGQHGWTETVANYHRVRSTHALGPEDVALPAIRAAMLRQKERYRDQFIWGAVENKTIYRIPDRFCGLV